MQESSLNRYENWIEHEIFSKMRVPPEVSFFLRLDGWKFKNLSEAISAERPFDEKFARCLVSSGKTLFKKGLNPALIYIASDELNILYLRHAPFQRRIEKTDSILASLVSSAFTLSLQKFYKKEKAIAFDSRIIAAQDDEKIIEYLTWRQMNNWRNHNNAYAYWILSKMEKKPSEISKKLKGLRTKGLHEFISSHGLNLANTSLWQRRGILIYKQPYIKKIEKYIVARRKINENWKLPNFTSEKGRRLIKQILEWTKQKKEH